MRAVLKVLGIVVVLLLVVVVAAVAFVATLDPNDYKDVIAEKAKEATGRDLKLDGNILLDLSLSPTLVVENVTFANADWGSRPEMATLKRLEAQIEVIPAILGEYRINKIILEGLDLLAETNKDGVGNWVMGEPAPPEPSEPGELIVPVVQQVLIQDVTVTYRDGQSGQETVLNLNNLIANSEDNDSPLNLDMAGDVNKTPFEAKGTFGSVNTMLHGGQAFPIDFVADLLGVKITAKGTIQDPAAASGIGVDFAVTGPDLNKTVDAVKGLVPELGGVKLPALGTFKVAAKIAGSAEELAISGLDVALGKPDFVAFALTGAIADVKNVKGVDLTASVNSTNLNRLLDVAKAFVPELKDAVLPAMGALAAKATVKGSVDAVAVSGLDISLGQPGFAAITAKGGLADAINVKGLNISVAAKGNESTKTIDQARGLVPELGAAMGDMKLPPIGPFSVAATIKGAMDAMAISDIDVGVGQAKQLLIKVSGGIADAIKARGLSLNIALEGANATPLVRAVAGDGIMVPAFKLSTTVSDPEGGYALNDIDAKIGRSDLSGNAAVKFPGGRPTLTAKLASTLLDLDELMPKQKGGKKGAAKPAASAKKGDGRVFPDDPLPLEGLKAADATVSFRGATVKVNGAQLKDLAADVSLQNGNLALKPFSVLAGGGSIKGNVGLNAAVATPALDVDLNVAQLDYGQLLKEMDVTDLVRGKLDVDTKVAGKGMSVRQIMAGLNGKLRVVTENGFIDSKLLNVLSSDLGAALTFGSSKGDQDIRCGVVDFDIVNGQADARAIVVETGGISVIGEGGIDLKQEKLDLSIDPKAKNPSLVKVAMISVDVGGTLASPSFTPNVGAAAVGAVTGAVGGVADIAKGGASGLSGLVNKVTGQGGGGATAGGGGSVDETDYCKLALAGQPVKRMAPKPSATPAKATSTQPPAPAPAPATAVSPGTKLPPPPKTEAAPKPVEKAKEALGGLGKSIDKGLKGLFK